MEFTISGYRNDSDVPDWKREIGAVIAANYEQKAMDYDSKLREALISIAANSKPGFAGIDLYKYINGRSRLECETETVINGRKVDIGVDMLLHTISIYES
jgi:hypothetical protein